MFVDILLVLVVAAIAVAGFFYGTIKLILAIIALYASMLLASLYFKFLAVSLVRRATSPVIADTFSFFLILIICFVVLFAVALYTFRYIRLPGRLEILDRVFGIALGLFLGIIASAIVAMLLRYTFIDHELVGQSGLPLMGTFQQSTRQSQFLPVLQQEVLPRVYVVVSPWMPDTAQPLFFS
jgi:uncharacterized membrane protein required for colicin V production